MPLHDQEREALLENYDKHSGLAEDSTETEETTDASTEDEATDPTTDETVDGDTDTEEKEVTDDPAETKDYESEDDDDSEAKAAGDDAKDSDDDAGDDKQKMVPHGLFHEEREKRKFLQGQVQDLQTKLDQVLQDYKRLVTKEEDTHDEDDVDEFGVRTTDPKIKQLEREIAELREFKKQFTEKQQNEQKVEQDQKHAENVKMINERLEKEGMPGFIFATDAVGRAIRAKIAEDPSNRWLFSPEGWYKVYKEVVYPEMAGLFTEQDKTDLLEKKKGLKSKQKIATKHGTKPTPKDDESGKKWTFKDYMDLRKSQSFD